jgi:hypothetical protein
MPTTLHDATNWSEIGQIEIIGRLAEIGRVLHIPDAEILLAGTNVHELNAFCLRYNQSRKWVLFGCVDEIIADRYRPGSGAG